MSGWAVSRETSGLLLQLISTLFGVVMSICAKQVGSMGVGVMVIILGSRLILLVATAGALWWQRINPLKSKRKLLLLARGFLGFTVISSIFWAVQLLPLADATVLSRLSPILIALLAPLLLHEPHSPGVWLVLPPCLVGVVVMARPSFLFGWLGDSSGPRLRAGALAVGLSQAVAQALTRISVRALGFTEPSASIIMSGAVVTATGSAVLCLLLPGQLDVLPNATACALLALMGCMACGLQVTSTEALKRVRVAPAAAVNYLSVVWALIADYAVFGHRPSLLSLLGAALVCGSTAALMLWGARAQGAGPTGRDNSSGGKLERGGEGGGAAGEERGLLQTQEEGGSVLEAELVAWGSGGGSPHSSPRRREVRGGEGMVVEVVREAGRSSGAVQWQQEQEGGALLGPAGGRH